MSVNHQYQNLQGFSMEKKDLTEVVLNDVEREFDMDSRGWLYNPLFCKNWKSYTLYDLASWVNGLAFRDISFSATGRPVIKIAELKAGITDQTKFTEQEFGQACFVEKGDMLFSWSGNPDTSIDVFWWRNQEGWLNQHIFKVTPHDPVDKVYFYYLLKYLMPNFAEIARNKQTTGLGHVTGRDLHTMTVRVPPLPGQRTIAGILGALDDKIELNRRMNQTLEQMAQTLFRSWFVDFDPVRAKMAGRQPAGMDAETAALFPDTLEDSILGPIPQGWHIDMLPNILHINPQRTLKKGQIAPYLDMANMPTGSARALEVYDRNFGSGMKFKNGDTLVARITPCLENGKTAFVDFLEIEQIGWGSTEYIVLHPKHPFPEEFAYFLARTEEFRSFAIANMTGSSGRQRVPTDCFSNFTIVVPSEPVVKQFGIFCRKVFTLMKTNDEASRNLAAARDVLLPKLLSGEVRVPQAEKMVKNVS